MSAPIDRRRFARELAAGAALGTVVAGHTADGASQEAKPDAAVDQLLAILKARFPDRLDDEQWIQIRGKLEGQLKSSQTLAAFKLHNSDEPATVFYVDGGS